MRLKLKTVSGHLEANDPCLSGPHWERLCLCISYPAVILKFKILFQRSRLYIRIIRWLIPWRIFVECVVGLSCANLECWCMKGSWETAQTGVCLQLSWHTQLRGLGIGWMLSFLIHRL